MAMFLPFIYQLGSIMTRAAMFQVDYTLHHEQCSTYPALIGVQVMLARWEKRLPGGSRQYFHTANLLDNALYATNASPDQILFL